MQVNEEIYGLKEKWKIVNIRGNYPNTYPDDEKLKIANFLNATVTPSDDNRKSSTLGNAIYLKEQIDPTFDLGRPIPDMSICFTAMSGYSPYRKIRFISTRTDLTDGSNYNITEEATQEYDIFNFAYSTYTNGDYNNQSYLGFWKTDTVAPGDTSATQQLYNQKWNPVPINIGANGYPSFPNYYISGPRNSITFVTQLPVKHIVLIPFIKCKNSSDSDSKDIDLKTYLSTYKTSHPRINMIYAKAYASLTDTGFQQSSTLLSILNFNVLTALSDYYGRIPNNTTDAEKQTDLMIPFFPSPGITLGGCLTGTNFNRYNNVANSSWNNNLNMYAYIDCVDLKWDTFNGDGTATVSNCLYCNADDYTAEEITLSIRKAIACFGLFFCEDSSVVNTKHLDDAGMFLGTLENGIGYGAYTEGVYNRDQPQWNWKDMSESPYDPSQPPTPSGPDNWKNNGRDKLPLGTTYLANHWYYISDSQLKYVLDAINGVDLENLNKSDTFGLNPIEGVLQLRRVYLSAYYAGVVLDPVPQNNLAIGLLQVPMGDTYAASFLNNQIYTYECVSGYYVSEPTTDGYDDFRTYQPFAAGYFYDAFCGVIELDPAKFLNKYITITQTVDFTTGDKITSLFASESSNAVGERIATLTGNCAEELPINGIAAADYLRNKFMLKNQLISQGMKTVASTFMGLGGASISAVTGNPIGAALQIYGTALNMGAGVNDMKATGDMMQKTVPPISRIQNGTSNVEAGVLYRPTLFLTIPKMQSTYNEAEYGDKTGFSGYKIATLQSCGTGTHIVSHPRISISGTVQEERMIIDQLQKGIYVKSES